MNIRSRYGFTLAAASVPPATSLITGGESHAQLRCLRRPTGAARTPHTVYVKTLYRIAGRNYCRDHIIKAPVAAGGHGRSITQLDPRFNAPSFDATSHVWQVNDDIRFDRAPINVDNADLTPDHPQISGTRT